MRAVPREIFVDPTPRHAGLFRRLPDGDRARPARNDGAADSRPPAQGGASARGRARAGRRRRLRLCRGARRRPRRLRRQPRRRRKPFRQAPRPISRRSASPTPRRSHGPLAEGAPGDGAFRPDHRRRRQPGRIRRAFRASCAEGGRLVGIVAETSGRAQPARRRLFQRVGGQVSARALFDASAGGAEGFRQAAGIRFLSRSRMRLWLFWRRGEKAISCAFSRGQSAAGPGAKVDGRLMCFHFSREVAAI